MKIDWVAEGFAAMRDCGEDISIVYARRNSAAAQPQWHWFELAHDKFDGIGGLAHLLRDQGCTVARLPVLRGEGLSFASAVRGLITVLPALRVREQRWRQFDATRQASFRPVRERVAFRLLSEEQTRTLITTAGQAGVTVNSLLLFHLDRAVCTQLTAPSADRLWMIPVNLRGALRGHPEHFLKMSFLALNLQGDPSLGALHASITRLKARACHWGSWIALHLGKLIGAAGLRRALRSRDRQNNGWTGIFSNLGLWEVPGSDAWIFGPAVSRAQPVGAGCVTMNGRMAVTIQLHEALSADLGASYRLLEAWLQGCLPAPAHGQSGTERFPISAAACAGR